MSPRNLVWVSFIFFALVFIPGPAASAATTPPSSSGSDCPPSYVRVDGRCVCRWGNFEAPIPPIEKGRSICDFIESFGTELQTEGPPSAILGNLAILLTVLTVVAGVGSITIGGYYYMTAGGSADRVRTAKIWIGSALIGITLALLAYIILSTIHASFV